MSFRLPTVYPLTDARIAGRPHLEQVRALVAGGARMVQLRDKGSAAGPLLSEADACVSAASDGGALLLLNDRADLARLAGCGGVHLGEEDLPVADARALLGPAAVIGASSHDPRSARTAESAGADYVAFGPVFPTRTKGDAGPAAGLGRLRDVRAAVGVPVAAIGGITLERAAEVLDAGADAVAVIGDIVGHGDLRARIEEFRARLEGPGDPPRGLVFLTGFMGSGKSAVGRCLAARLGRRFVDLDGVIEAAERMTVAEIFVRKGEGAFRDAEDAIVQGIPRGGDVVMALGGGTLLRSENADRLVGLGTLLWLDLPPSRALARCRESVARPLLRAPSEAARLLRARLPGYRRAHARVEVGERDPEQLAAGIEDLLAGGCPEFLERR